MANYAGCTKSNEFKIKTGMEEFARKIFDEALSEDTIYVDFSEKDGALYCSFSCYGDIFGLSEDFYGEDIKDDYDACIDDFVDELQKVVAEDSSAIIVDAGNEKLRYVGGGAYVITSNHVEYLNIWDVANNKAQELLKK